MPWRLLVIDGADQGRLIPLANAGSIVIGNSRKHADVCLNDLYVSRVHCQVAVAEGQVSVNHVAEGAETFVNGKKVAQQPLRVGDIIRIGNSHLRLEEGAADDPATGPAAATAAAGKLPLVDPAHMEELADHILGRYELGLVLGKSHSGIVFQAYDVKADQTVALKVLSPEFGQTEPEMQTFARVMKTALPLRHPSLVTVLGAGKTGPYCWIAREYVQAESGQQILEKLRDARKIDWRSGFHVAYHVARGLEFVHARHVFHGNITPRNLLIDPATHQAKLADLLLSKALEGSTLQRRILEQKVLAEMCYLAPEQTEAGAFVDNLCDIYSLGAVVYTLLTCRPPLAADAPEDLLAKIRSEQPEHPKVHQRSIPPALDRVVMKMLAKQQMDRYPTATALVEDLERVAEEQDEPLTAGTAE